MKVISDKFFIALYLLVPIFLITGPALPDIAITFCGIYFLISFIIIKKKFDFLKDKFFLISLLFWFIILFISIFANYKIHSFQDSFIFFRLLIIPIMAYFFFLNTEKKIKIAISIIFLSVIFVTIDTLFQFFNYNSEFGFQEDLLGFKSEWYGRLTGPFGDELIPGAYLSKFALLGFLFFVFVKKIKYQNILELLYLSTVGFVCFASGERMALATYFLSLFFLLFFLKDKRVIMFFAILISFLLISSSIKFHPFYNDYKIISSSHLHQGLIVEKSFECNEKLKEKCVKIISLQPSFVEVLKNFEYSAYGEIYNVALKMFQDNIFTGVGISNYQRSCINIKKYNDLMINYKCASHPHNTYIQWLAEGGLITFFSFIIYLTVIFYFLIKSKNSKLIKLVSIASMIILFWPLMSTGSLIKNWNGITTFYIISLCFCLNRIKIS